MGVMYTHQIKGEFVLMASAEDVLGNSQLQKLRESLSYSFLFGVLITIVLGFIFAGQSLKPISAMNKEISTITAYNLRKPLNEGNRQDEIAQLAINFNQMLHRLEQSFDLQRSFVSNASHELRTPLTAIMGQIEVALMDDDPKEWQETLRSVLDDARQLNRLSNGLLALAKVGMDESAVKLIRIQLDEVFWQVRSELLQAYPHYTVKVDLTPFSDEKTHFVVLGNEPLLRIALINLLENGCKFSSDNTVSVRFETQPKTFEIHFFNQGTTIPADEVPHIFKPFRRGTNARQIAGHGIGLSLTERIVRLHRGSIAVESEESRGTVFVLSLPQKI